MIRTNHLYLYAKYISKYHVFNLRRLNALHKTLIAKTFSQMVKEYTSITQTCNVFRKSVHVKHNASAAIDMHLELRWNSIFQHVLYTVLQFAIGEYEKAYDKALISVLIYSKELRHLLQENFSRWLSPFSS